jgi:tetratricopeptide (TPR) repeat protein
VRSRAVIIATAIAASCLLGAGGATGAQRENSTELYRNGARLAIGGELDRAILVFKKVVDISPSYCLGHYGLGKAYLYKYGMLDEAIKQLKLAVRLDRKLVRGYFYLGIAYYMDGKYPQAIDAFKSAYGYDDTYIEALYNMGIIYDLMHKSYESTIYFRKYISEKLKEEEEIVL